MLSRRTCPWVGSSPALSTDAREQLRQIDNGYAGEPYYELTTDTLHGFDAQYSLPIGDDRGYRDARLRYAQR